jgi:ABC-type xylose transport system substrate-binding protein
MDLSEANRIFKDCEELLKKLKIFNKQLINDLNNNDKEYYQHYLKDWETTFLPWIGVSLKEINEVAEHAGWWKKKTANTYMNDFSHEIIHIEQRLNLLGQN